MSYILTIFSVTKTKLVAFIGLMIPASITVDLSIKSIFTAATEDMDFKKFSVIALINGMFLVPFIFVSLYDYVCDLIATRMEMRRRGIPVNIRPCIKWYKTLWEMVSVMAFSFFIWIFAVYTVIIDNHALYEIMLWITAIVYLAGIVHEFDSIGKNLEKANGEKPGFFKWIDNFVRLMERTALRKLLQKCGMKDDEGVESVVDFDKEEKKLPKDLDDKK